MLCPFPGRFWPDSESPTMARLAETVFRGEGLSRSSMTFAARLSSREEAAVPDGEIDLEAYFRRIDYRGPREPVLDSLIGIHAHHVARIPFENLDVLLRRPIRLDPASLTRKLIDQ